MRKVPNVVAVLDGSQTTSFTNDAGEHTERLQPRDSSTWAVAATRRARATRGLAGDHLELAPSPTSRARATRPARQPPRPHPARALRADLLDPATKLRVADVAREPQRDLPDQSIVGSHSGLRAHGHEPSGGHPHPQDGRPNARARALPAGRREGPGRDPRRSFPGRRRASACPRGRRRRTIPPAWVRLRAEAAEPLLLQQVVPAPPRAARRAARAPILRERPLAEGESPGLARRVHTSRASRRGLSARTVPRPTATASSRAQLVHEPPALLSGDSARRAPSPDRRA